MRARATLLGAALLIAPGVTPGCSLARATLHLLVDSISISSKPNAASQPTTTKATNNEVAKVEPGIYRFKAKVKNIWICLNGMNKVVLGIATVNGKRCVFTGLDVRWAIDLEVQEVDKPLWFLKASEPVTIVVHSPTHVFGGDGDAAIGEVCDFSLKISLADDNTLWFGPLTTPNGVFAKEGGFAPTTTEAADNEVEKVEPGTYKFKAKVKDTWMCPIGESKCLYGVTTINGKQCVFSGIDTRWAIDLDVQEVDRPLWFLKAGEPVTIIVHSPTVFFRNKNGRKAIGEVFDFELTVSRTDDSVLAYHVRIPTSTVPK